MAGVLTGRTAAGLVTNTITLIAMLLIGLAVGFRPSQPAYQLVLALALVVASPAGVLKLPVDHRISAP